MNAKELEDVIRTAAVIRTARKLRGKTQSEVANYLGVSQSFLSKMENGRLIPSSSQWFLFCRLTQINPSKTFETGFIDHNFSVAATSPYPDAIFKCTHRYLSNQTSKVRSARPFIDFLVQQEGQVSFEKYCEEKEVDPDFFRVLDHQHNFAFILDLVTTLIGRGSLKLDNLTQITQSVSQPLIHGILHEEYDQAKNPLELIERLIQNSEKYDTSFDYQVEIN